MICIRSEKNLNSLTILLCKTSRSIVVFISFSKLYNKSLTTTLSSTAYCCRFKGKARIRFRNCSMNRCMPNQCHNHLLSKDIETKSRCQRSLVLSLPWSGSLYHLVEMAYHTKSTRKAVNSGSIESSKSEQLFNESRLSVRIRWEQLLLSDGDDDMNTGNSLIHLFGTRS